MPPGEDPGHSRRGAAYVVTGTGEQALPGLADGRQVTVTVPSKDSRGRLITWTAEVGRIVPGSDEWGEVAGLLAARRRAGAEPPASLPERWAAQAAVFRLSPSRCRDSRCRDSRCRDSRCRDRSGAGAGPR